MFFFVDQLKVLKFLSPAGKIVSQSLIYLKHEWFYFYLFFHDSEKWRKKKINCFLFSRKRAQVYYFNIWWVFDVRHSWDIFTGLFVVYFCVFSFPEEAQMLNFLLFLSPEK